MASKLQRKKYFFRFNYSAGSKKYMIAEVIVDVAASEVDRVFDYVIPKELSFLTEGYRVLVPFGHRVIEGFVISIKNESGYDADKLKEIKSTPDDYPVILKEHLYLASAMKDEFNLRYVDILRLFIPAQMRRSQVKELKRLVVTLSDNYTLEQMLASLRKGADTQAELLEYLSLLDRGVLGEKSELMSSLTKMFSAASIRALQKKGFLEIESKRQFRPPYKKLVKRDDKQHTLTNEQKNAINTIINSTMSDKVVCKNKFLLHGVTASGKTEVYMRCIQHFLEQGKTAIMLVPEISLTPQTFNTLRARFGSSVAILHSGLSVGERFDEWCRLINGEAHIAIGARSAIFAPLENVGIIIIDEEHDSSYVSDNNPRYCTKFVASLRADYNNAALVLGSATPSIDSYLKATEVVGGLQSDAGKATKQTKVTKVNKTRASGDNVVASGDNGLGGATEYTLLEMQTRVNQNPLPKTVVVNMSDEIRAGNKSIFSRFLVEKIGAALSKNMQVMLFINRRGYASFIRCVECGYVAICEACDVSLSYHRDDNSLKCHFCSMRYNIISACPKCDSSALRQGAVGTQRIADEIKKLFPKINVLRLDHDTTKNKDDYINILSSFANEEAQVLVGTQMITKGHDFKNVCLVGILDADISLYFTDYKSTERTFQLITQVSGRAGRDERQGMVVLQTYRPTHYVYSYAIKNDYLGFYKKEVNIRQTTNFPPFTKIVRILAVSESEQKALDTTQKLSFELREALKEYNKHIVYFGASRSPINKIEHKFRFQILIRLKRNEPREIMQKIFDIVNKGKTKQVNVFAEINPQNLS